MKKEIAKYLKTDFIGKKIYYFDSLASTNIKAKEIAMEAKEGTVIIAEEQTSGRGRLGRSWISPKGKGIWMSIILKPEVQPAKVAKITLIGAAAVNQGLKDIKIKSSIKWPNDIIIEDKKVSGILTEMSCETNRINYVIMGIGINVNLSEKDLNVELKDKVISLKQVIGQDIDRNKLFASVLNHFEELYIPFKRNEDISETIDISRRESILKGKEIRIIKAGIEKTGKALDIDEEGQLIIEYEDGSIERVFSGEVSIRGIDSYI